MAPNWRAGDEKQKNKKKHKKLPDTTNTFRRVPLSSAKAPALTFWTMWGTVDRRGIVVDVATSSGRDTGDSRATREFRRVVGAIAAAANNLTENFF